MRPEDDEGREDLKFKSDAIDREMTHDADTESQDTPNWRLKVTRDGFC